MKTNVVLYFYKMKYHSVDLILPQLFTTIKGLNWKQCQMHSEEQGLEDQTSARVIFIAFLNI